MPEPEIVEEFREIEENVRVELSANVESVNLSILEGMSGSEISHQEFHRGYEEKLKDFLRLCIGGLVAYARSSHDFGCAECGEPNDAHRDHALTLADELTEFYLLTLVVPREMDGLSQREMDILMRYISREREHEMEKWSVVDPRW